MSRALHVININSGAICVRTSAADDHPMILRPIDFETVMAIRSREVPVKDVLEAIAKEEMSMDGFSWREYDAKRRAAEEKFNVSRREMIPVNDEDGKSEEKPDEKVVSMKALGIAKKGGVKRLKAKDGEAQKAEDDTPRA